MTDYIKRDDAIAEFTTNGSATVYGVDKCKAIISRLQLVPSADVVEVVRCKDCKYWQDQEEGIVEVPICARIQSASEENPLVMIIGENGYCSYGERAEA